MLGFSREYVTGSVTRPATVTKKKGKNCPYCELVPLRIKTCGEADLVIIVVFGRHLDRLKVSFQELSRVVSITVKERLSAALL